MAADELVSAGQATGSGLIPLYCHPLAWPLVEAWRDAVSESSRRPEREDGFYLWAEDDHVELCHGGAAGSGVWVPLSELERRAAQGGDLARACGVSARHRPRVLDALAGWGVDGLVLARRGCAVTLVERQPVLWLLQQDLIRRSGSTNAVGCCGDGFDVLAGPDRWDVVYLDPMFPGRGKTALPGKRMQWLAQLATPDSRPLERWLRQAMAVARERVVLKRRRRDPQVLTPDWQILGRTVRYDVYRGVSPPDGPRSGNPGR